MTPMLASWECLAGCPPSDVFSERESRDPAPFTQKSRSSKLQLRLYKVQARRSESKKTALAKQEAERGRSQTKSAKSKQGEASVFRASLPPLWDTRTGIW